MDLESIRNFCFISTPLSIAAFIGSIVVFANGEVAGIMLLLGAILFALPLVSYFLQKKKLRDRENASVKYLSQQMQAMQTIVTVVRNFNRIFMLDITDDDIDEILSSGNAFAAFEAKAKKSIVSPEAFAAKMSKMLTIIAKELQLSENETKLIREVMDMANEDITQQELESIAATHSRDLPAEMSFLSGKINYEKACLAFLLGLDDLPQTQALLPNLNQQTQALCKKKGYM